MSVQGSNCEELAASKCFPLLPRHQTCAGGRPLVSTRPSHRPPPLYLWLGTVTVPGNINYPIAIFIIFILVCYVGMVYGPVGAFLAEFFPSRIRYTSVSVPYHIGNGWGGGLVPFVTSAAFAATGSIGYALLYPILVPAVCFVIAVILMPETRKISIWKPAAVRA